jgi:hypothetical protein
MKSLVLSPVVSELLDASVSTLPVPTLVSALEVLAVLAVLAVVADVLADPNDEKGEKLMVIDRLLSCHDVQGRAARSGRPR